ncbi:MAG: histidine--tRNA ligase [Spirochaetae bacterium HGW-Spirochaetae-3]|jgi:histidyl-tRNA synthetase|nr:MAG: histidine--tRNA ligase [Spirochaetae bacterium HGW-Spirochaetae-3]
MSDIIQPRVLKGFRDFLPQAEMEREALLEALTETFRRFGFVPIDTPVLEYAEILLGKAGGETEKQVYRFKDNGERDVAMRFDLTVPFARFMAEHAGELYLPFRRYHMAKVWRGENTQRGRYREFMQCDFDIVGVDTASADFDIMATIAQAMSALGVPGASIHVNHRGVFNRFLAKAGISGKSVEALRVVDKLAKIGAEETRRQLAELAGDTAADEVLEFIKGGDGFEATLERMTRIAGGSNPDSDRLAELFGMATACGLSGMLTLSPSITRGLDYYTGVVFETFLDEIPEIGSVCSGGRYNDLASLYTRQRLPGVGASVGIDRLIAAFEALGRSGKRGGYTRVLVANSDPTLCAEYQAAASALRAEGIACEVYPEAKKLVQQYAYAELKGAAFALIRGPEEKGRGAWLLRNLSERANAEYASVDAVIAVLQGA